MPAEHVFVITCEHGGNKVPKDFAAYFRNRDELLESHRGYDAGALELAKELAGGLGAPLFFSDVTRLLVDLNRSPLNRGRFSEITGKLSAAEKEAIENLCYAPYRDGVQSALRRCIEKGGVAVHISVHTFTPVLHGRIRTADVGFLYDPSRKKEAALCLAWQETLRLLQPGLKTRRNYPYRGKSDGFAAWLRDLFPESSYLGIELEANRKIPGDRRQWLKLKKALLQSLVIAVRRL